MAYLPPSELPTVGQQEALARVSGLGSLETEEWRDPLTPGHPATPTTAYGLSQQCPHPSHREDVEPLSTVST